MAFGSSMGSLTLESSAEGWFGEEQANMAEGKDEGRP